MLVKPWCKYKKFTAYQTLNVLFFTFLLIIHRFLDKHFFINNLLNVKSEEINKYFRDRFFDCSLQIQSKDINTIGSFEIGLFGFRPSPPPPM